MGQDWGPPSALCGEILKHSKLEKQLYQYTAYLSIYYISYIYFKKKVYIICYVRT